MADWGLLSALQGQNPWDDIRAGRANELRSIMMQEGLAQKAMDEQIAANQKIAEYQNILSTVSSKLLPPDVEKLKTHEEKAREDLKKKINSELVKNGGDVRKWMLGGGVNDLNKYKNELLMGEPTQQGLNNAFNYAQFTADTREGLIPRDVEFRDAQGNVARVPFQEQIAKFSKGELPTLKYGGAYKRPDFGDFREMYSKVEGKNPYQSEAVKPQTVYQDAFIVAKQQGLNDQDADDAAKKAMSAYDASVKQGGQPFQFKTRQYHVSSGMGTANDAEESMKYILEGVGGALNKDVSDTNFWQPLDNPIPLANKVDETMKGAFGFAPKTNIIYTSDRLGGLPLGKATVPDYKFSGDLKNKVRDGVKQIDNTFKGFALDNNGKVYYVTEKSNIEGEKDASKRFIPFTDASIDELVLSAPANIRPKLSAKLRKGLIELGNYQNLTPSFTEKVTIKENDPLGIR